ncbi:MAG: flagellar type III secretion system protein FlhB [Pseudomonadota bacterium]
MSDEDKETKTEEPTEKKIQDATEKGQTPQSKETSIFFVLVASLAGLTLIVPQTIDQTRYFLAGVIENSYQLSLDTSQDIAALGRSLAWNMFLITAGVFALSVLAALGSIATNMAPLPIPDRIKPDLKRISMIEGWKRIYSKKGLVEFLKATAKIVTGLGLVSLIAYQMSPQLIQLPYGTLSSLSGTATQMVLRMIAAITLFMAVVAALDFAWSRYQWRQDLRMSKQELKDEHKQTNGDPMIRAQQRSIARERARSRMMNDVPTATVVIVNPTHYSVALRYDPAQDNAPRLVAKGRDLVALKIREIATESGVPIHENVQVARSIYRDVEVNQYIPEAFFEVVAEIIILLRKRSASAGNMLS